MGALLPAAVERRGGGAAVAARPRLEADGGVVVVLDDAHGGTAEELLQVIRNSTVGEEVSGLDTVHGTFYLLSHSLTYCCACEPYPVCARPRGAPVGSRRLRQQRQTEDCSSKTPDCSLTAPYRCN